MKSTYAHIGLITFALALPGCAIDKPPPRPLVKISKDASGQPCKSRFSVANRYPIDITGNIFDVAFQDSSGRNLDRMEGSFRSSVFQSGFVASFVYTSKIACEQIAAVKIYGISFMRMDGSIFSGFDRYELELAGIIMK